MRSWLVLVLVIVLGASATGQGLRIATDTRICTAKEIRAKKAKLPSAIPAEPEAAIRAISAAFKCNARPVLLSQFPRPSKGAKVVYYRSDNLLGYLFDDMPETTFRSQPEQAEIWVSGAFSGTTTTGGVLVSDKDLRTAVLKKTGFEDCSFGEWTRTDPAGELPVVSCTLTPVAVPVGDRLAIYNSVDLFGGDVDNMRVESMPQCLAACMGNPQCQALTFNTNPKATKGPNCFLKGDGWDGKFYEQAISVIRLPPGGDETLTVGAQRVLPNEVRPQQ